MPYLKSLKKSTSDYTMEYSKGNGGNYLFNQLTMEHLRVNRMGFIRLLLYL